MAKFKFLFSILLLNVFNAKAQTLVLNLLNGEVENYEVENIRSIKFPGSSMAINQYDGTIVSFEIAAISSYQFNPTSSRSTQGTSNYEKVLRIYPNPASDNVRIAYLGKGMHEILIEITDGSGRYLERLFSGLHQGETIVEWNIRSSGVAPGQYLCRVIAGDKSVTGKIIVQ